MTGEEKSLGKREGAKILVTELKAAWLKVKSVLCLILQGPMETGRAFFFCWIGLYARWKKTFSQHQMEKCKADILNELLK